MNDIILIISIVLNVVLAICIFFKSALNDILKEYWRNKQERKRQRNQRIIDLRKHLSAIQSAVTSNLVIIAVWWNADNPEKEAIYKGHLETSLKISGESFRAAREDLIYYPEDIKTALEAFFAGYQKFIGEITEKPIYKERLVEMSDYLNSSIERIIAMIDKQRFRVIS